MLQACIYICDKQCCSQGQNSKAKDETKAWTLEVKAKVKALNPRGQGQDQGHKFVSSRILEAKACHRGLHHWYYCVYSFSCCQSLPFWSFCD